MKARIAIGVLTTASRKNCCAETLRLLGRKVSVFCDRKPGFYHNNRAAWSELFKHSDRALLIQDDMTPATDWYETVNLFAETFPVFPLISFFHPFPKVEPAWLARGYWLSKDKFWAPALLLTREFHDFFESTVTQTMLDGEKFRNRPWDYHHDSILQQVMQLTENVGMTSCPPIFQHRFEPSTLGNSTSERVNPVWGHNRSSQLFCPEGNFQMFRELFRVNREAAQNSRAAAASAAPSPKPSNIPDSQTASRSR
jgi:hypothetical protein